MIDLVANTVPDTIKKFSPMLIDTRIPPTNIRHFSTIKISRSGHFLTNLRPIILVTSSHIELSRIFFTSIAIPIP